MATKAQSSAAAAKKPAVEAPEATRRRCVTVATREKIAKLTADGYTVRVVAKLVGFDVATVKRHITQMRRSGDVPPSTRAPRITRLPASYRTTPPRELPEDIVEARQNIIALERKVASLQTPPRPCPPEWQHVAAEWDRLERLRQQSGAKLPAHGDPGFTEATLTKNHPKEP